MVMIKRKSRCDSIPILHYFGLTSDLKKIERIIKTIFKRTNMKNLNLSLPTEQELSSNFAEYEQYSKKLSELVGKYKRNVIENDTTLYFEIIEHTENRRGHIWFSYHESDRDLVDKIELSSDDYYLGETHVTREQFAYIMDKYHPDTEHIYSYFVETAELESFVNCETCQEANWYDGITICCSCAE